MSLSLFPARVPIGSTMVGGVAVPVMASPEFLRSLEATFLRLGGAAGMDLGAMALLASFAPSPDHAAQHFIADSAALGAFSPPPVALAGTDLESIFGQTPDVSLRQAVADMQIDRPSDSSAVISELAKQVDELRVQLAALSCVGAALNEVRKYAQDLEINYTWAGPQTDWEHPGSIGAKTANAGAFTTISASGQITSTLTTGTPPMVIASTTKVSNLNVDKLDDGDWAAPGAIGTGTPNTGAFTTISTTGNVSVGQASYTPYFSGSNSGIGVTGTTNGCEINLTRSGGSLVYMLIGAGDAMLLGTKAAQPVTIYVNDVARASFTTTGQTIAGTLTPTGAFGCNGKTAQTAYASGGALAAYVAGANGFDSAANASALHAMVVAIRAALVADGIMS